MERVKESEMNRSLFVAIFLACSLPFGAVSAKDAAPDIQQFKPVTDMQGFLLVQDATLMSQFRPGVAMTFNYAVNPFEVHLQGYGRQYGITDGILGGDLTAAFGIFDWWEVGMRFPFMQVPIETSFVEDVGGEAIDYGIGDITFTTRFRALDPDKFKIGLAPELFLTVPSGNETALLGRGKPGGGLRLAISQRWKWIYFAANLGYAFYPRATIANLTTGDELLYGAAIGVSPIADKLDVRLELDGSLTPGVNDRDEERFGDLSHSPLELAASVQYKWDNGFAVHGGLGTGLTPGFGSPSVRVFAGASWAKFGPRDRDKDGVLDPDDACLKEPEDVDGFEDADGCPDTDNDGDGFPDEADKCPDEAEDKDGYMDGDGCIDPDNDGDGLLDGEDACVDEPEDMDGFQDGDGCPDLDNDGDGIPDSEDRCPDSAETVDGWQDEDGCPDPDNDGDTFLDEDDLCPNRAEDVNGTRDEDGCPDDVIVARKDRQLHLLQDIGFSRKSRLTRGGKKVVKALAEFLEANPDILQVEISGHTSSRGSEKSNKRKSLKEARAVVKQLKRYGIAEDRLEAVGFGEARPVRSNRTKAGREANHRIEAKVLAEAVSEEPATEPEVAPEAPAASAAPGGVWGLGAPQSAPEPAASPAAKAGSAAPWGAPPSTTGPAEGKEEKSEEPQKAEEPKADTPSTSPWGN